MEQPKVEPALPVDKLSSDSPPNIVSPGVNADPEFPPVKSTILKQWIASNSPPKLEPNEDTNMMTPESLPSEGTLSDSKSPPMDTPLTLDTSFTTTKASETSYYQCRACDSDHRMNDSYPDKRPSIVEDDDPHWIMCDHCLCWYHCECVDLEPYETFLIDVFSCSGCHATHGRSKSKVCVAPHRNKFDAVEEINKPMEVGTKPWVEKFVRDEAKRFGPPSSELVKVIDVGDNFEGEFSRETEWKNVYLIKKKAGLGITMPEPGEMYIDELVDILGDSRYVETIDVYRQASALMSVGRYRELLNKAERPRLFNILSLEFTGTRLAELVRPPSIVKELSWAERYWPDRKFGPPDLLPSGAEEACDTIHNDMRPDVELFCLMGMGGSFTDFHIDFGGSSVWYHVYKGQKIFYIVEPTKENLDIYQKHQLRTDREIFLGDVYKEKCWRVVIEEGNTLMIPAGWIHDVYTPVDSLVFGGNFLTNLNVELQCEVNSHEMRCLFESRYLYPNFETINWYAARSFTEMLREFNDDLCFPAIHLMRGAKAVVEVLGDWIDRDKHSVEKTTQLNPTRPYIHGESRVSILNALTKEFKQMEMRMEKQLGCEATMLASLRMESRMSRIVRMIPQTVEEQAEDSHSPRAVRISLDVPEVDTKESLKVRIPRKSEIEEKERENGDTETVSSTTENADYEVLDRAERGGSKKAEKRKRPEKVISSSDPSAKKKSSPSTTKQRLADRMKNLKNQ